MLTILLLLSTSGDRLAPRQCDRAELNSVYGRDAEGNWKPNFTQWIFWDFDTDKRCWVVRGWVIVEGEAAPPARINGRLRIWIYKKHEHNVIEPTSFSRTQTPYDPELENREILPADKRTPIFRRGQ